MLSEIAGTRDVEEAHGGILTREAYRTKSPFGQWAAGGGWEPSPKQ